MTRSIILSFLPTVNLGLYTLSSTVPAAQEAVHAVRPAQPPAVFLRQKHLLRPYFPYAYTSLDATNIAQLNVTGSPAHRGAGPRLLPASCAPPNGERLPSTLYVEGEWFCCAPLAHPCMLSSSLR